MSAFVYPKEYDVIVIGAGHAGVEAALAAARLGCQVGMLTQNLDSIAQMSCNPAIGGLGKGHMVREIDALGGVMGLNTDATAIQMRMLNGNKGPSVRAPRAQCDKKAYQFRMKWILESQENLELHQGNVAEILVENDAVSGLRTQLGMEFRCKAIVLSAGTFMRGLLHVGLKNQAGGRMGDGMSTVSDSLRHLGFKVERFKTGTPCRINGKSINFAPAERQDGEEPPPPFSFMRSSIEKRPDDIFTLNYWADPMFHVEQLPCWITHTTTKTHDVIRANLHLSPMYCGIIEGIGPRYCPSIEDKVVRFADKEHHQVFLEPEGRHTREYYVNGVSTSLPYEVQYDFIRSIVGLENAEILRPGYAVEYDFCPPTQLSATLETKQVAGLYFAGQINGTSGYEEAAGQGLIAGANAALKILGQPPLILKRSEAYLGVMIDDLISKDTTEPYRMFTSRAEYRLGLRQDNTNLRLTPLAAKLGLVSADRIANTAAKQIALDEAHRFCVQTQLAGLPLTKWFRRTENSHALLPGEIHGKFKADIWEMLENDLKYEGYLIRQQDTMTRASKMEDKLLPEWLDYSSVHGLKREAQFKLQQIKPRTFGQAGRLQGVTPADLSLLAIWVAKQKGPGSITE